MDEAGVLVGAGVEEGEEDSSVLGGWGLVGDRGEWMVWGRKGVEERRGGVDRDGREKRSQSQ